MINYSSYRVSMYIIIDECILRLPRVINSQSVGVGHVRDDRGGRVSNAQETGSTDSLSDDGRVIRGCHVGRVGQSRSRNVRVVCGGSSHVGIVSDGSVGNGCVSRVAHAHIGLAHAGVGRVDGLGEGGDLAQVSVRPEDVGLLAGHGMGGEAAVANGIARGHRIFGLAGCDQGAHNEELLLNKRETQDIGY